MTRDDLKNQLTHLRDKLAELETAARKLQNQNFADIVASAKGRVHQLTEHADLDRVQKHMDGAEQEELPFDPNAKPSDAKTYAPGDARFQQANTDFKDPNAVELNADGTLRQAPNSIGAGADVRTES